MTAERPSPAAPDAEPFWRTTPLARMTRAQWESLCDGCGRCCLLKLEDEDDGTVAYANVHCRLFDPETRRCGAYARRKALVSGCVILSPQTIDEIKDWMPATCAYRLLAEGKPLFDWHPLISGDPDSVRRAGVAVQGSVPEYEVDEDDLPDHLIEGML
ncbi:YcgN family cysteine cluster protein [Oceanicella actignis]|uniref:YcgN family cysteine cluster protein n=1 Tax=Oceanicella actignis TaxID=1189325 RepID=UPI0011E68D61|nr:YcgN family cysteine cluster protein [Oceanicella actignis]TYO89665.1 hypothetical protein LY05_01657 [Oceanicella actignis]